MDKKRIPQKIINRVEKFKESIKEDNVPMARTYIFGSYARGRQHLWSDIDLCVISSAFGKKIKDPINYLWSKRLAVSDFTIEPVGFNPQEFKEGSPLISEIKKYGIEI